MAVSFSLPAEMSRRCPEDSRVFFGRLRGISATSHRGRRGEGARKKEVRIRLESISEQITTQADPNF